MAERRKYGIISLDTASKSTGWSYFVRGNLKAHGCIKTRNTDQMAAKLSDFKEQLVKIYKKYNPTHVVIENGYYKMNVTTLKVLSYFVAVARQASYEVLGVEPELITTVAVRKFFGAAGKEGKEQIFNLVKKHYKLRGFKFKTHNDVTDSVAQGLYYYLAKIKEEVWPEEKLINPRKTPKRKKKSRPTAKKR